MFRWLRRANRNKREPFGKIVDSAEINEINSLKQGLAKRKTVPKTSSEADKYLKELSKLCALLAQQNGLPSSSKRQGELILGGKDVPSLTNGDRWHSYRWGRVKMAKQLHREKRFETAIGLWSEVAVIDYLGLAFEHDVYMGGIETCVKRGKIAEEIACALFHDAAKSFQECDVVALWSEISTCVAFPLEPTLDP